MKSILCFINIEYSLVQTVFCGCWRLKCVFKGLLGKCQITIYRRPKIGIKEHDLGPCVCIQVQFHCAVRRQNSALTFHSSYFCTKKAILTFQNTGTGSFPKASTLREMKGGMTLGSLTVFLLLWQRGICWPYQWKWPCVAWQNLAACTFFPSFTGSFCCRV